MTAALVAIVTAFVHLDPAMLITPTNLLFLCPPALLLLAQDMPILDRWQPSIQAAVI